jgi:hypothetical protein
LIIISDPVTTDPKGEALNFIQGNTPTLGISTEIMLFFSYDPDQDEDIVYATRNRGSSYDVGSSHPGGGEAPKGLAVRQ